MGLEKVQELIECIRQSTPNPNALNSVIFRLMAAQSGEGTYMLMHALYYNRPNESLRFISPQRSWESPKDQNIAPSTQVTFLENRKQMQPQAGIVEKSQNVNQSSQESLSADFQKLNEEMQHLSSQHPLVKDLVESYMFLTLRKSIFGDMCIIMKKKYNALVQSPNIPEEEKMKLHKMWRDLYEQYNKIKLPQGFNLIPPSQRKSLEGYIAEYREHQRLRAQNQTINKGERQAAVPTQSKPVTMSESRPITVSEIQPVNEAQLQPVKILQPVTMSQSQPVELQPSNMSQSQPVSKSIPHSAASNSYSDRGENGKKLSSNPIIIIDDDNLNLEHSATSSRPPASNASADSPRRIILDDDSKSDTGANQISNSKRSPRKEKSDVFHSDRVNSMDLDIQVEEAGIGNEYNTVTSRNKPQFSKYSDDESFISAVRSLNKASSPEAKKALGRDSDTTVDYKWQEGFVQGLFYNFGMDSPFGVYEQSQIDQVYLEGFKAASTYYARKVGEQD